MNPDPEYKTRLADRQHALEQLRRRDDWIANGRLGVFVLFGATLWIVLTNDLTPFLLVGPVAAFAALIAAHEHTRRRTKRSERAIAFYEAALRRLNHTWMGKGYNGLKLQPPDHLYAADLDIFGEGSLFELLCTARTPSGRQTLANWLCAPATPDDIVKRQEAVKELAPGIDLRENLAIEGDDIREGVHTNLLRAWAAAPPVYNQTWVQPLAWIISAAAVATAAIWIFTGFGIAFLVVVAVEFCLLTWLKNRIRQVIRDVDEPGLELAVLAHILSQLELQSFKGSHLQALTERLRTEGIPASAAIRKLDRIVRVMEMQNNMLFALVAQALLWPVHSTMAIERWRRVYGRHVVEWVEAVGELEALSALAGYAFDHPEDVFPVITETGPCFEGEMLGHPLLREEKCVRNSVHFRDPLRILVISGSNMSGKSTLLRTCGINAVIAQAGAPVRAKALRMSSLNIGATLRVVDSIQDGASRFYAEIQRLKHIVDLTQQQMPVLFLMDEILHGTNSHDRTIGASAIMRRLLQSSAIGFITTHDLAITKNAEALAPRARNMHFEDQFEDGQLAFDYTLREGVVQKSNALQLMRSVGLDVPDA